MYSRNDYRYYLEHRASQSDDFLMHYGVKGMKWGKHAKRTQLEVLPYEPYKREYWAGPEYNFASNMWLAGQYANQIAGITGQVAEYKKNEELMKQGLNARFSRLMSKPAREVLSSVSKAGRGKRKKQKSLIKKIANAPIRNARWGGAYVRKGIENLFY